MIPRQKRANVFTRLENKHICCAGAAFFLFGCAPLIALAQDNDADDSAYDDATSDDVSVGDDDGDVEDAASDELIEAPEDGGYVETYGDTPRTPDPGQAESTVTRDEIQMRQPRSAPDALRYEPGVFVQQTAHSQGSAFVRGRTGQQTVLLFDGVRLNNSLFRQGPNQYFFTIDSGTIEQIDVTRGSGSTRYGTDAIAGAIDASPLQPTFDPEVETVMIRPKASYRFSSADGETGGRLRLDAQLGERVGILAGVGARRVGMLESGGPIYNPSGGELPEVPRFADDGRTQLGTGFKEFTADVRAKAHLDQRRSMTLAYYTYRQFDAPRTDQCAPPYAPSTECLYYDEQFRDLLYGSVDGRWGKWAADSRLIVSWQGQHESRVYDRPESYVINRGTDDVDTFGFRWHAKTDAAKLTDKLDLRLRYGADYYRDQVTSNAEIELVRLERVRELSRGQYMDGSSYSWGGLWSELEFKLANTLVLRAGGRLSHIEASSPADEESRTIAINNAWTPLVGNLGAEWWASESLTVLANIDQGFRAPNLDDLTSRQRTGPGFQIENPDLEPERGTTYEVGARLANKYIEADAWAFYSTLKNAISRTTRDVDACPPGLSECLNTWARLQLVNLPGRAVIWGAEGSVKLKLPQDLSVASTISYAWGEGPRPVYQADDSDFVEEDRVPLSRIPPLNGTAEVLWRPSNGAYLGAGLRWAKKQDRLAISDVSDERIPLGGTPGFAVIDARAGWRFAQHTGVYVVFENLTDAAYRYHGSSVNGPGRSFSFQLEMGL